MSASSGGVTALDIILDTVGPFGAYQWVLCAFLWWVAAPLLAATVYGHMLLLLTPDHWCLFQVQEGFAWNASHEVATGQPTLFWEEQLGSLNRCPSLLSNSSANTTYQQSVPCPRWQYDYENIYPTIISELDWVCEESWRVFACHTAFWGGGAVGVIALGAAADSFGRRPVIALTHLICACAGLATNYLNTTSSFLVGRTLVGFAALPMSMTSYVLMLEYVSSQWRLTVSTLYLFSYSLVGCLLPWLAKWIHDWRTFNLLISLPAIVVPLLYCLIPESLRWLLVKGHTERLKETLTTIARFNGKPIIQEELQLAIPSKSKVNVEVTTLLSMLRQPYLRTIYFVTLSTWVLMSCCYVGGYVLASTSADPFLLVSSNAAMDLLANALGDRLAGRCGRRLTMAAGSLCAALAFLAVSCSPAQAEATPQQNQPHQQQTENIEIFGKSFEDASGPQQAIGTATSGEDWWTLSLLLVARVALTSSYNVNYLYGAEVYPTVVRTRALALRQALGAVGSFLSPQVVFLSKYSVRLPLLVFGCMSLSSSFLSLLVPETLNAKLPETLLDAQNLKNTELTCPCACPCTTPSFCFKAKKIVNSGPRKVTV